MDRKECSIGYAAVCIAALAPLAAAQTSSTPVTVEGVVFLDDADPASDARCALINTAANEFIIRTCDRQLVFVTLQDEATGYVVDTEFNVTLNGAPRGRIGYATDGDDFRTLFWVSDESFTAGPGFVLDYNATTRAVEVATNGGQSIVPSQVETAGQFCDPSAGNPPRFDGAARCPVTRAPCGAGMIGLLSILAFAPLLRARSH